MFYSAETVHACVCCLYFIAIHVHSNIEIQIIRYFLPQSVK